jgi:hypothetical protein
VKMPDSVLLDNDVVLKACSYRLSGELLDITTVAGALPHILEVARFTLRDHVKRSKRLNDKAAAETALHHFLGSVTRVEPTEEEVELAADFEQLAQQLSLELDSGESQLFAILLRRKCRVLLTGDKRAIAALERISPPEGYGRISCIEQLATSLIALQDYNTLRIKICAEPNADKTFSICFSCSVATPSSGNTLAGLSSYIKSIRNAAPNVLSVGDDLRAVLS